MIQAKYKGVPFYTRSETLNKVGQDYISHRYPKSKAQYKEPMGETPFECSMDIFFSGETYLEDFNSFKVAISDPAPGRLFIPTFSLIIESMSCEPSDFKIIQTNIGEISASVSFGESIQKPAPTKTDSTPQDVAQQAEEVFDSMKESFEESYEEPTEINNIKTAEEDGKVTAEKINRLVGGSKKIQEFLSKIPSAIRSPEEFGELLLGAGGMLKTLNDMYGTVEAFDFWKQVSFIGFDSSDSMNDIRSGYYPIKPSFISTEEFAGFEIPSWVEDTASRIKRNLNRFSFLNTVRVSALVSLLEIASFSNYTTTEEIDNTTQTIGAIYAGLIEEDTTGVIIPDIKTKIEKLKSMTDIALRNKRQQAFGISTVFRTRLVSGSVLSYQLYGEYLQSEGQLQYMSNIIVGLNRDQPANRLKGTIKVPTVG